MSAPQNTNYTHLLEDDLGNRDEDARRAPRRLRGSKERAEKRSNLHRLAETHVVAEQAAARGAPCSVDPADAAGEERDTVRVRRRFAPLVLEAVHPRDSVELVLHEAVVHTVSKDEGARSARAAGGMRRRRLRLRDVRREAAEDAVAA